MLIDYISPEKLPHFICWLDWNFFAHKTSFAIAMCTAVLLNLYISGGSARVVISFWCFFAWLAHCYIRYGAAVG